MRLILAPGKLVLVGEYAVLDGAPAVVLAIDRGVSCQIEPGGDQLVIETPDGDDRFVRPALEGHAAPGSYRFSAWNPVDLPGKPGFGGSAAAAVAACIAAGRPAEDALAIHASVQGGGSGVDVRAAIHGGMLRVEGATVRSLPPVCPTVIWSGASARTGPRVSRYLQWSARAAFVAESTALVDAFPADPIAALAACGLLLSRMAEAASLDYRTPALDRIVALARAHGGAAKPSGAGGGDCAVALFPDMDREAAFRLACAREELSPIPVAVAPGARSLEDP